MTDMKEQIEKLQALRDEKNDVVEMMQQPPKTYDSVTIDDLRNDIKRIDKIIAELKGQHTDNLQVLWNESTKEYGFLPPKKSFNIKVGVFPSRGNRPVFVTQGLINKISGQGELCMNGFELRKYTGILHDKETEQ